MKTATKRFDGSESMVQAFVQSELWAASTQRSLDFLGWHSSFKFIYEHTDVVVEVTAWQ